VSSTVICVTARSILQHAALSDPHCGQCRPFSLLFLTISALNNVYVSSRSLHWHTHTVSRILPTHPVRWTSIHSRQKFRKARTDFRRTQSRVSKSFAVTNLSNFQDIFKWRHRLTCPSALLLFRNCELRNTDSTSDDGNKGQCRHDTLSDTAHVYVQRTRAINLNFHFPDSPNPRGGGYV